MTVFRSPAIFLHGFVSAAVNGLDRRFARKLPTCDRKFMIIAADARTINVSAWSRGLRSVNLKFISLSTVNRAWATEFRSLLMNCDDLFWASSLMVSTSKKLATNAAGNARSRRRAFWSSDANTSRGSTSRQYNSEAT